MDYKKYKKTFDSVWREGLWNKLVRDNVNGKLLNVIHSTYIKSCVMVNEQVCLSVCLCGTFTCNMGVKQRENL